MGSTSNLNGGEEIELTALCARQEQSVSAYLRENCETESRQLSSVQLSAQSSRLTATSLTAARLAVLFSSPAENTPP